MADVKVCDRCGVRLTDERSMFNLKPNGYALNVTLFKKPKNYFSKLPDIINTNHDLCIECTTKLAEWLEFESSMKEE